MLRFSISIQYGFVAWAALATEGIVDSRRRKKTAGLCRRFLRNSGSLNALTPLSIRRRTEMPKEVKIKLRGHGSGDSHQEMVYRFIPRSGTTDKSPIQKMRNGRTKTSNDADVLRDAPSSLVQISGASARAAQRYTVPPTVIFSILSVG
ncbi:MAG TPA: hypothetical protein VL598_07010 [Trinickia sp.]|uniref:hypothetical protein n=1 Tax=Trinickia sp. TaxID=2571163 RepID=UPI002CEE29A6|nr:hypothetical protein [Trinickia sp.]HTI17396.1 hypothetical protein [Trinickia sp.]